ncbi:hypothetical protein CYMTET_29455, partial [Cymbomonas tetramitiformis]
MARSSTEAADGAHHEAPRPPAGSARAAVRAAKSSTQHQGADEVASASVLCNELRKLRESMPLTQEQAQQAAKLIKTLNSEGLVECGLAPPLRPTLAAGLDKLPVKQRLHNLQNFISSFEYNHTNDQYFNVRKNRPLARVMDTAKNIIRTALPIKCIEAVFLGIYLTA